VLEEHTEILSGLGTSTFFIARIRFWSTKLERASACGLLEKDLSYDKGLTSLSKLVL
jgi:hypothetical protein